MILKLLKLWLRFRGKDWYAIEDGCDFFTKRRLYWLYRLNQDDDECGWFTAWELFLWGFNRGPIPK